MSSGDKDDPFPFTLAETKTILRLPIVAKRMARHARIDREHDIPYLAGYSKDGKTIYIDCDLKPWVYDGRAINADRFLTLHEEVEKALIDALHDGDDFDRRLLLDCLRMKSPRDQIYFHCHGVATCVEEHAVEQAYGRAGVVAYNRFMKSQVKRAEDERIRRVPRDLDMTPYEGNDAQDRRLRAAMKRAMH
jgi:hypothetical protein